MKRRLVVSLLAITVLSPVSAIAESPHLLLGTTSSFEEVWSDRGSGADTDGAFYRTRPPSGYFSVGDYGQNNYDPPTGTVLVVQAIHDDPRNPLLRPPAGFREIVNDRGSGADQDGSFWQPVPPDGYGCIGSVVQRGYDEPQVPDYRCIRLDQLEAGSFGGLIYADHGSGADQDMAIYELADTGVIHAQQGYGPPKGKALQPRASLLIGTTSQFVEVWNDRGSGADTDGAFYRTQPPSGYFSVGDYGQNNYGPPTGTVLVVQAVNDNPRNPVLRPPAGFREIVNDRGSGADQDGSFWQPVPPDGYGCIGSVVQRGYGEPQVPDYRCIRLDQLEAGSFGGLIYADHGSGAAQDMAIYELADTGVIHAQQGYGPPKGKALQPRASLLIGATSQFVEVWNDRGSGADTDGAFYRTQPPSGYFSVGDYGQNNYGPPTGRVVVVQAVNDNPRNPVLRPPVGFREIVNDRGSGADQDGSFWQPVPPDGYGCIGSVVQRGYDEPQVPDYRCIRLDHLEAGSFGDLIYADHGSGAAQDMAIYELAGTRVIHAQQGYGPPTGRALQPAR